ncbi:hypothetical protein Salat_2523900, partial [Sesamum alatum]
RASFQSLSKPKVLAEDALVSELIERDGHHWRTELVERIFPPKLASSILAVPLGRGYPNALVWHFDKKGVFSVRSAYNFSCRMSRREMAVSSTGSRFQSWDFI